MKPIHLLIVVQWQGREIALALSRFASAVVRSLVEEVCETQGLPPGERWILQFEGSTLAPEQRLHDAIPGIEERRGIVLHLLPESEMLPRTDHEISLGAPGGAPAEEERTGTPEPFVPPLREEDFEDLEEEQPATGVFRALERPSAAEPLAETLPVAPAPVSRAAGPPTLPLGTARTPAAAAPAAPRTAQRQATVRYYHRMNPERTYPLLVVLSKKMIREVVKKAVAQASSQRFAVATEVPVEIEPVLPGCDCYPPTKSVSAKPDEVSVTFWVVPRVLGKLSQPHVLIRQDGKDLAEVPLEIKVVKQTVTVCAGVLSLLLPFVSTLMQHARLDFSSQVEDNFALYAQAANFLLRSLTPEMLGAILLATTLGLYLLRRPRQREVFWDVESVGPNEQLDLAKQAIEAGDDTKATRLLLTLTQAHPEYQAVWLFLGEWHHTRDDHKTAVEHYEKGLALGRATKGDYFRAANSASRLGDSERAYAILKKAERDLGPSGMSGAMWYNLGCYATRLGRHDEAVGFLGRAVAAGFARPKQFRTDPDLKPLRGRPDFQRLLGSLNE